jgi:hypothetical protein
MQKLVAHLAGCGVAIRWDDELAAGDTFGVIIQADIDNCDALCSALTPSAVASRWLLRDIAY